MTYFSTEQQFINYIKNNKDNILIDEGSYIFCRKCQQNIGLVKMFNPNALLVTFYDFGQEPQEIEIPIKVFQSNGACLWIQSDCKDILSTLFKAREEEQLIFGTGGYLEKKNLKLISQDQYIFGQLLSKDRHEKVYIKFYDNFGLPRAIRLRMSKLAKLIAPVMV